MKNEALNTLLNYVFDDECEDYFSRSETDRKNHIYLTIRTIAIATWGGEEVSKLEAAYK